MDENIKNVVTEKTEEVIEKTVENMDPENLKDLGVFGAGVLVGIIVHKNVLAPAWRWIQEKRKSKNHIFKKTKAKPDEKDEHEEDEEPNEDDSQD